MVLSTTLWVREQIETAKAEGKRFVFDLREEAMGDKCASVHLLDWLVDTFHLDWITVVESSPGRTPFMLADYKWEDPRIIFEVREPYQSLAEDELNLHTSGQKLSCLWEFNAWFGANGFHRTVPIERPEQPINVVFSILTGSDYNERRDMSMEWARKQIDELKKVFASAIVLHDKPDPLIPEILVLPMHDALKHIESARVFVGGDTGFSHFAAVCGIPVVGIYPDHARFGKPSWSKAEEIAEWWQEPSMRFTPLHFAPNTPHLKLVTLGTDHRWSIDHVIESIKSLA